MGSALGLNCRVLIRSLFIIFLTFAASSHTAPEQNLGKRVSVSSLTANTWLVRSVSTLGEFGEVESNAVLVTGPRESVLIDTPATIEQTVVVLD